MTDLFQIIGSELHGTGFTWSEFNKNTWISYVNLKESEGGAAMFSLEQSGNYDENPWEALSKDCSLADLWAISRMSLVRALLTSKAGLRKLSSRKLNTRLTPYEVLVSMNGIITDS